MLLVLVQVYNFFLESEQLTGAFKVRGAFNKLSKLKEEKGHQTIYTASSGNHGLACVKY